MKLLEVANMDIEKVTYKNHFLECAATLEDRLDWLEDKEPDPTVRFMTTGKISITTCKIS